MIFRSRDHAGVAARVRCQHPALLPPAKCLRGIRPRILQVTRLVIDGEGEVVAVHSLDVTLEGVVAGKAGGVVAARAGVGQGASVGPGEPQQSDIINYQTNLTTFFKMSDTVPYLREENFPFTPKNTGNGQKELTKAKEAPFLTKA